MTKVKCDEKLKKSLKETFDLYSTDESLVYRNGACDAIAAVARKLGFDDDFLYEDYAEHQEMLRIIKGQEES